MCVLLFFLQETLSTLFTLYVRELPIGHGDVDPTWPGRQGVALALHAAADILTARDLPVVATFLISRALVCFSPSTCCVIMIIILLLGLLGLMLSLML